MSLAAVVLRQGHLVAHVPCYPGSWCASLAEARSAGEHAIPTVLVAHEAATSVARAIGLSGTLVMQASHPWPCARGPALAREGPMRIQTFGSQSNWQMMLAVCVAGWRIYPSGLLQDAGGARVAGMLRHFAQDAQKEKRDKRFDEDSVAQAPFMEAPSRQARHEQSARTTAGGSEHKNTVLRMDASIQERLMAARCRIDDDARRMGRLEKGLREQLRSTER